MQSTLQQPSDESVWRDLAPLLDEGMSRLGKTDREAVVLRFFKGQSAREVAATLQISEAGAHKRVGRALEKLRQFFVRRGVPSTSAAIAGAISAHSVQGVPIALAKVVSTVALANRSAAAWTWASTHTALFSMKVKMAMTVIAGTVLLGMGYLLLQPKVAADGASAPREGLPIKFANNSFSVWKDAFNDKFINEVDSETRRTTNSAPAGHIQSLIVPTSQGSADYLRAAPAAMAAGPTGSRYVLLPIIQGSPLLGKRIRVSGWIKAEDVRNWAGVSLHVASMLGRIFASDSSFDRPIHGTTGWQPVSIVTDIPNEACVIHLAPTLYGTGEIWCDDFQIDLAAPETPITDDRRWTVWSQDPNDYSEAIDPTVGREGRTAFRITYKGGGVAPKNAFVWWGQHNRDLEKFQRFLGHTVRMSVWARTENVSINCGLNFEPKGPNGKRLADHSARKLKPQIGGTTDWVEHSVTCWVPEETRDFQTGFFLFGGGTLWLDMDTFKCEIVETPPGKQLTPVAQRITQPGDLIFASSANSRGSEGPANAIDNNKNTKYLNWDSGRDGNQIVTFSPSGFAVQPSVGPTVVTGMGIQSANDADDRDPDVVVLEGSNDANLTSYERGTWTPITTISNIAAGFTERYEAQEFFFTNATAYRNYRWRVEATRIMPNRCCMQVAEVWLTTSAPPSQATSPATAESRR